MSDETPTPPPTLTWEFHFDEVSTEAARVDLQRALMMQVTSFATRFDPLGKARTDRNERRLLRAGLVLCLVALGLTAALMVHTFRSTSEVRGLHLGLLCALLVFVLIFAFARRIRRGVLARTEARLGRLAGATIAAARMKGSRRYELRGESLLCHDDFRTRTDSFRSFGYGLVGEQGILLYADRNARDPSCMILVNGAAKAALAVHVETFGVTLESIRVI